MRRGSAFSWAVGVVVLGALVSCSAFDAGKSGEAAAVDAGGDAGTDAADSAAASEVAAPVVNILPNGNFEEVAGGCPRWSPDRATLVKSSVAHSGAASCLVCTTDTIFNVFTGTMAVVNPKAGARYYGEAWVRAPESGSVAGVSIQLLESSADGEQALDYKSRTPSGTDWELIQVNAVIPSDGTSLAFELKGSAPPGGGCFIIDDVLFQQQ